MVNPLLKFLSYRLLPLLSQKKICLSSVFRTSIRVSTFMLRHNIQALDSIRYTLLSKGPRGNRLLPQA